MNWLKIPLSETGYKATYSDKAVEINRGFIAEKPINLEHVISYKLFDHYYGLYKLELSNGRFYYIEKHVVDMIDEAIDKMKKEKYSFITVDIISKDSKINKFTTQKKNILRFWLYDEIASIEIENLPISNITIESYNFLLEELAIKNNKAT